MEIDQLNKTDVYDVMKEILYSLNYGWFLLEDMVRTKHPEDLGSDEFFRLHEMFGAYEAKRLMDVMGISAPGVDDLIRLVKHSHWAVFESIDIEKRSESSFRMRTLGCTAQEAAKRWGMGYYNCAHSGLLARSGFFKKANANARVQRILSPPDTGGEGRPEDASCEWLISIEGPVDVPAEIGKDRQR